MSLKPKRRPSEGAGEPPLAIAAKTCEQCHESKPRAAYFPTGTTPDKLTRKCRHCTLANAERDRVEREARQAQIDARTKAARDVGKKCCLTCRTEKPIDEFALHGQAKDGHRRSCRECVSAAKVKRQVLTPTAKEKERSRRAKAHRKEANGKAVRGWKEKHPEAERAMRAVRLALKAGQLARPPRCQVKGCKFRGKLQGHHRDYRYPLVVAWCCPSHHRRLHAGEKLELVNGLPEILTEIPARRRSMVATEEMACA